MVKILKPNWVSSKKGLDLCEIQRTFYTVLILNTSCLQISTLLEIWRDYREETTTVKPVSKLPEPPGLRDRLIQEIQFFVGNVKDKAKQEGVYVYCAIFSVSVI